jgi:hypothetical protein
MMSGDRFVLRALTCEEACASKVPEIRHRIRTVLFTPADVVNTPTNGGNGDSHMCSSMMHSVAQVLRIEVCDEHRQLWRKVRARIVNREAYLP